MSEAKRDAGARRAGLPREHEGQLVACAQAGDIDAFEALVRAHERSVLQVALAITGNDADAADAWQETIIACWRSLGTFKGKSSFKTWLTAIAVNECRGLLRKRRATVTLDERVGNVAAPSATEANLEFRESLALLDEKYRSVMVLHYVQGFKAREIAEILRISVTAVTTRLARGRKQIEAYHRAAGEGVCS